MPTARHERGDREHRPRRSAVPIAERPDQDRRSRPGRCRAAPAPRSRTGRPAIGQAHQQLDRGHAAKPSTRPAAAAGHAGRRGPGPWSGAFVDGRGWRAVSARSSGAVGRRRPACRSRRSTCGGDLAELVAVLAGVVGAEEQLAAATGARPQVGLGSATVAAVRGGQRRRSGQLQWSHRPHFSSFGVVLNVTGRWEHSRAPPAYVSPRHHDPTTVIVPSSGCFSRPETGVPRRS